MTIHHRLGSYDVDFCSTDEIRKRIPTGWQVITDENVAVATGWSDAIIIPPGEQSKSTEQYVELQRNLAQRGLRRTSGLVALGGGVIGDLVGFVAATYMRGVPYLQVPTSLMAMVDSAVGGKVGIDLPEGKNLVGAFYPPEAVLVNRGFLRTLPEQELRAGMAEVYKYGYILDPELLESTRTRVTPIPDQTIIERCISHKGRIVQEDETETTGLRAILNFGHTMAHAIEKVTDYSCYTHGEAVAIGMIFEARLGERLEITPAGTGDVILKDMQVEGLPSSTDCPAKELVHAMRSDKKNTGAGIAFSLLSGIGECKLVPGVPESVVLEVLSGS